MRALIITDWTEELLAQIPDEALLSEAQRRRARKRQSYTGGVYWKKHNADVPNCRCTRCMTRREKAAAKAEAAK